MDDNVGVAFASEEQNKKFGGRGNVGSVIIFGGKENRARPAIWSIG